MPQIASTRSGGYRRQSSAVSSNAGRQTTSPCSVSIVNCAEKGQLRLVSFIAAGGGVIDDRTTHRPRSRPRTVWRCPAQKGRAAVSKRPLSARTSNGPFVQSRMNSRSYQPRSIMTWAMPSASAPSVPGRTCSQTIGLFSDPGAAGIDHDQARATFERLYGGDRMGQPGKVRVVAPKQDAAGILKVRHIIAGNTGAEGILRGQIPPPSAQLHRCAQVRTSERMHQALESRPASRPTPMWTARPR